MLMLPSAYVPFPPLLFTIALSHLTLFCARLSFIHRTSADTSLSRVCGWGGTLAVDPHRSFTAPEGFDKPKSLRLRAVWGFALALPPCVRLLSDCAHCRMHMWRGW
eukprot:EG_transcript_33387